MALSLTWGQPTRASFSLDSSTDTLTLALGAASRLVVQPSLITLGGLSLDTIAAQFNGETLATRLWTSDQFVGLLANEQVGGAKTWTANAFFNEFATFRKSITLEGGLSFTGGLSLSNATLLSLNTLASDLSNRTMRSANEQITGAWSFPSLTVTGSSSLGTVTTATLGVTGLSTLAGLSAGATTLDTLTASATTVTTLTAGASTLSSLACGGLAVPSSGPIVVNGSASGALQLQSSNWAGENSLSFFQGVGTAQWDIRPSAGSDGQTALLNFRMIPSGNLWSQTANTLTLAHNPLDLSVVRIGINKSTLPLATLDVAGDLRVSLAAVFLSTSSFTGNAAFQGSVDVSGSLNGITAAQCGYLSGVTSSVQDQFTAVTAQFASKVGLSGSETISGVKTFASAPILSDGLQAGLVALSNTELASLKGLVGSVTGQFASIQTQLDSKLQTDSIAPVITGSWRFNQVLSVVEGFRVGALNDPNTTNLSAAELQRLAGVTSGIQSQFTNVQDQVNGLQSQINDRAVVNLSQTISGAWTFGLAPILNAGLMANFQTVSAAQLSYLSTLEGNVQTSLLARPVRTGDELISGLWTFGPTAFNTEPALVRGLSVKNVRITEDELFRLSGLSSNVQAQLNTRLQNNVVANISARWTFSIGPLLTTGLQVPDLEGVLVDVPAPCLAFLSSLNGNVQDQLGNRVERAQAETISGAWTFTSAPVFNGGTNALLAQVGNTLTPITPTQLSYLSGLSASIQDQIDARPKKTATFSENIFATWTFRTAPVFNAGLYGQDIGVNVLVTAKELSHLNGITSAVQTQLNAKTNRAEPESITGSWTFSTLPEFPNGFRSVLNSVASVIGSQQIAHLSSIAAPLQPQLDALHTLVNSKTDLARFSPQASQTVVGEGTFVMWNRFSNTATSLINFHDSGAGGFLFVDANNEGEISLLSLARTGMTITVPLNGITPTQLGYLSSISSDLQTQLTDRLLPSSNTTITGSWSFSNVVNMASLNSGTILVPAACASNIGGLANKGALSLQSVDDWSGSNALRFVQQAGSSDWVIQPLLSDFGQMRLCVRRTATSALSSGVNTLVIEDGAYGRVVGINNNNPTKTLDVGGEFNVTGLSTLGSLNVAGLSTLSGILVDTDKTVSGQQLGFLSTLDSNVQTQLNNRPRKDHIETIDGVWVFPNGFTTGTTANGNRFDFAPAYLYLLSGLTGNVQTQLTARPQKTGLPETITNAWSFNGGLTVSNGAAMDLLNVGNLVSRSTVNVGGSLSLQSSDWSGSNSIRLGQNVEEWWIRPSLSVSVVGAARLHFRWLNQVAWGNQADALTLFSNLGVPRVGINQNDPTTTLDVGGTLQVTGTASLKGIVNAGEVADPIRSAVNVTGSLSLQSPDWSGSNSIRFLQDTTTIGNGFEWWIRPSTGAVVGAAAQLHFRFLYNSNGVYAGTGSWTDAQLDALTLHHIPGQAPKVGINQNNPTATLDVSGTAQITGTANLNGILNVNVPVTSGLFPLNVRGSLSLQCTDTWDGSNGLRFHNGTGTSHWEIRPDLYGPDLNIGQMHFRVLPPGTSFASGWADILTFWANVPVGYQRVGVNWPVPTATLDVGGTLKVRGDSIFDGGMGLANNLSVVGSINGITAQQCGFLASISSSIQDQVDRRFAYIPSGDPLYRAEIAFTGLQLGGSTIELRTIDNGSIQTWLQFGAGKIVFSGTYNGISQEQCGYLSSIAGSVQAQLDSKTSNARFSSGSGGDVTEQGTWIQWNRNIGTGTTDFLNQKGAAGTAGGFTWREVLDGGTVASDVKVMEVNTNYAQMTNANGMGVVAPLPALDLSAQTVGGSGSFPLNGSAWSIRTSASGDLEFWHLDLQGLETGWQIRGRINHITGVYSNVIKAT